MNPVRLLMREIHREMFDSIADFMRTPEDA